MSQTNLVGRAVGAVFLSLFFSCLIVAQSDPRTETRAEPSYDVFLHLVIGSNEGSKAKLPPSLSAVTKQIESNFQFVNYRIAGTLIGRVANSGNFEHKSLSDIGGKGTDGIPQAFLEWNLTNLRASPTEKGNGIQSSSFRFGTRVPVPVGRREGTADPVSYNYESIGLNLNKVSIAEATPTLIGTMNLPRTDGVIFLIMMVKPAEL